MSTAYEATLANFRPVAGGAPPEIAAGLATALSATGATARVRDDLPAGAVAVHASRDGHEDDVILVHTGDAQQLRTHLNHSLLRTVAGPARRRVVSSIPVPADVQALVDDGLAAKVERRLVDANVLPDDLLLGDVPAAVERALPLLTAELGELLTLDNVAIFKQIDEMVMRLRVPGTPRDQGVMEGVSHPTTTILALGLVASEAVRRQFGGSSTYGALPPQGWRNATTLREAEGMPALRLGENAMMNVAGKVWKRWHHGSTDSVHDMWEHVATLKDAPSNLPEETLDDAQRAARCELLDRAFTVAGGQIARGIGMVQDGVPPGAWVEVHDEKLRKLVRLMASGTGQAEAMAQKVLASDEAKGAHFAIVVMDVFVVDPTTGLRYDAIQASIRIPGKPVHIDVAAPYRETADAGVVCPTPVQRTVNIGLPDTYDNARIAKHVFSEMPADGGQTGGFFKSKHPFPKLQREVSSAWQDAAQAMAFRPSTQPLPPSDDLARCMRIAALAPIALFVRVASADGKVEKEEIEAFADSMKEIRDPLLLLFLASNPLDTRLAAALALASPEIQANAFAAAGAVLSVHPNGAAGQAALLRFGEGIAKAHGEIRPTERAVLDASMREISEGTFAKALADAKLFPAATFDDEERALIKEASLAVASTFVLVAGADGKVEQKEADAFLANLPFVGNDLLRAMIAAAPPLGDAIQQIIAKPDLAQDAMDAARRLFKKREKDGDVARNSLLSLGMSVAFAHGELRQDEMDAMGRVMAMLEAAPKPGLLVPLLGTVLLAGTLAGWQFVSAAAGITAWFVPVAIVIQLVLMGMLLLVSGMSRGYVRQVIMGTVVSTITAGCMFVTSLVVTALFPSALPVGGSALVAALSGAIGTVVTGAFASAVIAVVFRKR